MEALKTVARVVRTFERAGRRRSKAMSLGRHRRWSVPLFATLPVAVLALSSFAGSSPASAAGGTASKVPANVAAAQNALKASERPIQSIDLQLPRIKNIPNLKGKTILFVPFIASIFSPDGTGISEALSHFGAKVQTCDGQALPSTTASCMEQAIVMHAAAVITYAVPYQMVPAAYNNLTKNRIPTLVAFQAPVGKKSSKYLAFQTPDPQLFATGEAVDNAIIASSYGKAHVLLLGINDDADIIQLSNATHRYLTAHCPKCTVDMSWDTTSALDKIPATVTGQLESHPNINYVYCWNDNCAPYAMQAIQSSGRKVTLVAGVGSLGGMELVAQGHLAYDAAQSHQYLGWKAADGILRMLAGMHIPNNYPNPIRTFDSSNIKGLKLTPAAVATFSWFGHPTFESAFLKVWGKG